MEPLHWKNSSVVLIEDNPADIQLTKIAMGKVSPETEVSVIDSGKKALEYARGLQANGTSNHLPNLILLDINLPFASGFEILTVFKSNPKTLVIPIIIFSTSNYSRDVSKAFELGANAYITKPGELASFSEVMQNICRFWSLVSKPAIVH